MASAVVRPGLLDRLQRFSGIESEAAMARTINTSQQTLARLKKGESPSMETIANICEAFGMSIGEVATIKKEVDR